MSLTRVAVLASGAFGVLAHNGLPFAVTLERTYADPTGILPREIPKVPTGTYQCYRTFFHKGGYDTFEVVVPGHSRILLHRGNVETDSEGCILVAESFGELHGSPAILASSAGFAEFMSRVGGVEHFELTVREA